MKLMDRCRRKLRVLRREIEEHRRLARKTFQAATGCLEDSEVRQLLTSLHDVDCLMGEILYGSGLRDSECCKLRLKDIDVRRCRIVVRQGKGDKYRDGSLQFEVPEGGTDKADFPLNSQ